MSREVVAVQSGMRLDAAARLLRESHISGVPVIDASERVLGVLSERDIVRVLRASTGLPTPRGLLDLLLGSTPQRGPGLRELALERLRSGRVQQAMSAPARTIAPTESLARAAGLMRRHSINRLPVVDDAGRLVGIVTRADLVAGLTGQTHRRRGHLHPRPAEGRTAGPHDDPYRDA